MSIPEKTKMKKKAKKKKTTKQNKMALYTSVGCTRLQMKFLRVLEEITARIIMKTVDSRFTDDSSVNLESTGTAYN